MIMRCHTPPWAQDAIAAEVSIRDGLRQMTADDLRYTVRGRRGAGLTYEPILIRVRQRRQQHSASMAREAEVRRAVLLPRTGSFG